MTTLRPSSHGAVHRLADACVYRLRQALAFAKPQRPPMIPADIALHLLPGTVGRFRALAPADQRHLLAVAQHLRADGASNDLWIAGLLHDIGKAYEDQRVGVPDRAVWVIASRSTPIARLVRQQTIMPRLGGGVWIAAHHAELGGAIVRELGYNERICALVGFHDDAARAQFDPELARLRAADDAPFSVPSQRRTSEVPLEVHLGRAD